jgi:hypothetical protein
MPRLLALLFAVLVIDVRTSDACATAPPAGAQVRIAEEEALIVWDPATKTETFIRRAAFQSTARKFGFLVPTPTMPQLSEVPDSVFYALTDAIRPPVEHREKTKYVAASFLFESCMGAMTKSASDDAQMVTASPVRVLQTATVAGFNATTVEADNAQALTDWLGQNGFEVTPQLTKWLERYVTEKWKVTAFVVAGDGDEATRYDIATKAVKMTFPTERPFYPYREPQIEMTVETNAKLAPPAFARSLRVYFVSNERYAATLADQPWSAKVLQAQKLATTSTDLQAQVGAQSYMTVFVDESSPRRGIEELYFAPSADKADVKQPVVIITTDDEVPIPVDLIVIGLIVVVFVVRRVRRRR